MITASVMKHNESKIKGFGDSYLLKPVSKVDLVSELLKYLPCKVREPLTEKKASESKPGTKTGTETLAPEIIAGLQALTKHLEQELLPQWEKIHQHLFLDEIEDWANQVKTLGEKYDYPPLLCWCNQVFLHLESFDMEKLPTTLQTFPCVLDTIKENLNTIAK
jgi:hypothetical protein